MTVVDRVRSLLYLVLRRRYRCRDNEAHLFLGLVHDTVRGRIVMTGCCDDGARLTRHALPHIDSPTLSRHRTLFTRESMR